MLLDSLSRFNTALGVFQEKFPKPNWSNEFKSVFVNDFSFFSSRLEDDNLQYGETIRFLKDEMIPKRKIKSLLEVSTHREVLQAIIGKYEKFELLENIIKEIHRNLMSSELSWEVEFKPHLVGNYRNTPAIGYRQPFFPNKEYVPHYNIEIVMNSYLDTFKNKFKNTDNSNTKTHLITSLAFFHNKFLNEIHPFADGNGRVCRIIMGTMLMKNNCPPIFVKITSEKDRLEYINTIVECEKNKSDEPLIKFLANGMSEYLEEKTVA